VRVRVRVRVRLSVYLGILRSSLSLSRFKVVVRVFLCLVDSRVHARCSCLRPFNSKTWKGK
jgi:hypothetical protein